jgi:Transposase DDE domain
MAAAAVLTGARSITAIAEWAADPPNRSAPPSAPGAMPPTAGWCRLRPPSAGPSPGWALTCWPPRSAPGWLTVTVPASAGVRSRSTARRYAAPDATAGRSILLAAMDHAPRAVLAQCQVNGTPGEVPGFQPLLTGLDLTGTVVTADALHTHGDAAEFLIHKQAHYLFTVKANQPTLLDGCAGRPWQQVPVLDRTRDRAHGRVELRTLKAVSVAGFGFPHAAQVIQVTPQDPRPAQSAMADGDRVRGHQPHFCPGQHRPAN